MSLLLIRCITLRSCSAHKTKAVHREAMSRGLTSRAVDVLYSDTNNIEKPWGFLYLA